MVGLLKSQREALAHIEQRVSERSDLSVDSFAQRFGNTPAYWEGLCAHIQRCARVEMNFHPDRPVASGQTVAETLLTDGYYRSQFETQVSNGSLTAYTGGARDIWEQNMFGGAYHGPDSQPEERPKYGALALFRHSDGAAPRFGSCYFVLSRDVSKRCTFTYGDSHLAPPYFGTLRTWLPLLEGFVGEVVQSGAALGCSGDLFALCARLLGREFALSTRERLAQEPARSLDHYIEAQIHGAVDLSRDVEQLVADPAFRNTPIGDVLRALAARYSFELAWHRGFVLASSLVGDEFRGPEIPRLAQRIAPNGSVDCAVIGEAARSLHHHPDSWKDWGTRADRLQLLKKLWHVLVFFGNTAV